VIAAVFLECSKSCSHRPTSANASALALVGMLAMLAPAAQAETVGPLKISANYMADVVAVVDGPERGTRYVDLLTVSAGLDLDKAAGWGGASIQTTVQAGVGAQPNALAGTLEGINNSEVTLNRLRLFEAYLQQELPALGVTAKLGFIDLNADFYASDAASLLIAPPFGIGSELAATGPAGPSIYPSTAPTFALRFAPGQGGYIQFAAVNAEAGTIGDPGGPKPLLREGALLIAEAGLTRRGKLAIGAWTYTKAQDDLRDTDLTGAPRRRHARGAYLLIEQPLGSDKLTGFLRAGISDGNTGTFAGAWQAGVLLSEFLPSRPKARLSVGLHQAFLAPKFRANEADAGQPRRPVETGWEVTYEDQLAPWLLIQPDVQYIRTTDRLPAGRDAVVVGLRVTITMPGARDARPRAGEPIVTPGKLAALRQLCDSARERIAA
jgi:porin